MYLYIIIKERSKNITLLFLFDHSRRSTTLHLLARRQLGLAALGPGVVQSRRTEHKLLDLIFNKLVLLLTHGYLKWHKIHPRYFLRVIDQQPIVHIIMAKALANKALAEKGLEVAVIGFGLGG
jgi:hypothetical protein